MTARCAGVIQTATTACMLSANLHDWYGGVLSVGRRSPSRCHVHTSSTMIAASGRQFVDATACRHACVLAGSIDRCCFPPLCLCVQGLLQGVPAILLVGGGEGMGKLQATVEQLDMKLQGSAQVITVHELFGVGFSWPLWTLSCSWGVLFNKYAWQVHASLCRSSLGCVRARMHNPAMSAVCWRLLFTFAFHIYKSGFCGSGCM